MIYALSPSDENIAKLSASSPWKLQLERAGAASLQALAVLYALLSWALAAHSQGGFQARCFAHMTWRSSLPSPGREAATAHSP